LPFPPQSLARNAVAFAPAGRLSIPVAAVRHGPMWPRPGSATDRGEDKSGRSLVGGTRRGPVHRPVEYARTNVEPERQL